MSIAIYIAGAVLIAAGIYLMRKIAQELTREHDYHTNQGRFVRIPPNTPTEFWERDGWDEKDRALDRERERLDRQNEDELRRQERP